MSGHYELHKLNPHHDARCNRMKPPFARDSVGTANTDTSFNYDSLSRVIEETQTYGGDSRYITHDKEWNRDVSPYRASEVVAQVTDKSGALSRAKRGRPRRSTPTPCPTVRYPQVKKLALTN